MSDDATNTLFLSVIDRNFGGLRGQAQLFKDILAEKFAKFASHSNITRSVVTTIHENIQDLESRYLMLITKGSFGEEYLRDYF